MDTERSAEAEIVNEEMNESSEDSNSAEEEEDGNDDENEEDHYRKPIIDNRNITFKTKTLNAFLICSICMGYFKDAFTVIECLHTFCRSCIYQYLQAQSNCPHCGTSLGPNPLEKIKFDRQIQTFLEKIFPQYSKIDAAAERKAMGLPTGTPETPRNKTATQTNQISRVPRAVLDSDDEVGFEMRQDATRVQKLGELKRPFIRTSKRITINQLKKYLQKKITISDIQDLEITYRGEIVGNEHSVEYILKTRGREDNARHPLFKYRMRKLRDSR
eukprot:TRINITY_DN5220_c0_g1_i1.p1 TRINITY_DN5220_c0_g1~~TRINITY_DN5220_c0_g1_i1.p1  ORF type:complete len:289 (-),score=27.62 TRINITY_DN5220_c0_g1_i1:57-875(-)